ncbi:MAG: ChaN family lipoprotein [Phycisphaerae bacterium]|nr:ChaN family lipoprotein [Phycisphaerae bacterium]
MKRMVFAAVGAVVIVATGGCGRAHFFVETDGGASGAIPTARKLSAPRGLAMFSGHTARSLSWDDVRNAMRWADVILVGEQHRDAVAHEVELALVSDAMNLAPPAGVSMEMLERDEQRIVDAYLAGEISQAEFVEQTGSANWAAKGKWDDWYQPIVDAARDARLPLIAANAPRQYVVQARKQGYGVLWAHPPAERKRYFIPSRILTGSYARRFMGEMSHHSTPPVKRKGKPATRPTTRPATMPATTQPAKCPARARCPMSRRQPDLSTFFRAQLLWDATMAGSIVEGLDGGLARVIHLVGQFHTDFDGGTVQYLLDLNPDLKILTISLQNAHARELRPVDEDRADVVIYTLAEPPEDKKTDSDDSAD